MSNKPTFRIETLFDKRWIIVPGFEKLSRDEADAIADWENSKYCSDHVPTKYRLVGEKQNIVLREFGPRKLSTKINYLCIV